MGAVVRPSGSTPAYARAFCVLALMLRARHCGAVARPGGPESSLCGNGLRASGRRRTHKCLLRYVRRNDRRTPPSAEVFSYDSIRARDGGHNMDLPSPAEAVHRRGAQTRVAMHVTGLTSVRNCSAAMSVHGTDSHSARYMHVALISSTSLIISHQVDACSTVTAQHFFSQ